MRPRLRVGFVGRLGLAYASGLLGSEASLTFFNELPSAQRERALKEANVLLSWNFPREIQPQDYSLLQQVSFIQILSAGAD